MENTHTKGPWISSPHSVHNGNYYVGPEAPDSWEDSVSPCVAIVTYSAYGVSPEQQAANARLIAAAPEMLKALKWAVEEIDSAYQLRGIERLGVLRSLEAIAAAEGTEVEA